MPRFSAVLVLLLGACNQGSGDDTTPTDAKKTVDAAPAETSCGTPIPTTTGDLLNITGDLDDGSGTGTPVAAATVTAMSAGINRGTATSEVSGLFQVAATTGGVPVELLTFAATGRKSGRYFPRQPIYKSTSLPSLPLFTPADAATFFAMFGTQNPANGAAIITINDCADAFTANATVTVSPPGSAIVKYLHGDGSTNGTSTDATGTAVILNISPGTVTLAAMVGTQAYHAHAITADPTYVTLAAISEK